MQKLKKLANEYEVPEAMYKLALLYAEGLYAEGIAK